MIANALTRMGIGLALVLSLVMGDAGPFCSGSLTLVRCAAAQGRARQAPARKRPAPARPGTSDAPGGTVEGEAASAEPAAAEESEATTSAPQPQAPPSPEPRPTPLPAPAAAPAAQEDPGARRATLERLRARHDELRDAIFRSRARRETLEKALFSTRLALRLVWDANRNYTLARAELRLDGTRVWESGDRPVGDDPVTLAPRNVPPGPHVLGLRIEVRSRDNAKLGYTMEQSYTLVLAEGKKTEVEITVDEDGSLPSYNPDIEIDIDVSD